MNDENRTDMTGQRQPPNSLAAVWQRIDRIYCIALAERTDRRKAATEQFARVGLDGQVAFFTARRHPDDCEQGIFESHRACLRQGLAAGARHILVFEDDVVFGAIDARRLEAAIDYFMEQTTCSMLLLGGLVSRSWPTAEPAVRKVRYRCLAHAYLVKADLARQVADQAWQGIPIDTLLSDCTERPAALYPSIAFQSNSPSDNVRHQALDAVRRLFGGLRVIQMVNERYHRFRYAFIAVHLLLAGAVILWILS